MAEQEYIIEWRPIPGYEGIYEISNYGALRVLADGRHPGRILKSCPHRRGYVLYCLTRKRYCHRTVTVHSLVMLAFVGPRPAGLQINHIDGNKRNNFVGNLEYVTPGENMKHAVVMGLMGLVARGERSGKAKLNDELVRVIRRRLTAGESQAQIARDVGVAPQTVWNVAIGRTWGHVR